MTQQESEHAPAEITRIPVSRIEPNPHNPRVLFDKVPMDILLESIRKVGVLVPITVYPKNEMAANPQQDTFVLLDGERRWRCATKLQQRSIPAIIVATPTDVENVLTMFHIHNLREPWQLMPTALKLEFLMRKLDETNERKLAELTKLTISYVRRCKILLSYPRRFQNLMLAPPTTRLKPDFFIELQRIRGPALREKFPPWIKRGDTNCVNIILTKYLEGTIKAVTDFRILAEIYRGSERIGKLGLFYKEFDRFLTVKTCRIDDIDVEGASYEKEYKEVLRSAKRLLTQIEELPPDVISADKNVVQALTALSKIIQDKLQKGLVD